MNDGNTLSVFPKKDETLGRTLQLCDKIVFSTRVGWEIPSDGRRS